MTLLNESPVKLRNPSISFQSTGQIPPTSKAVLLHADGDRPQLEVIERQTPVPLAGQVLVKIAAAPINPSDVLFVQGKYGLKHKLPIVPGIEGSGTVVAAGKGLLPRMLLGRRVACSGLTSGDGTWAEYAIVDADRCIEVGNNITDEQAACMFVNPWTAIAMLQTAQELGHRSIVLTAGASQLSRMIYRLAQKQGLTTIHIVRSAEQSESIESSLGVEFVLNSSDVDFEAQLAELTQRLQTTIAFDAVAGEMTGILARNLPPRSRILVYGSLSSQVSQVGVADVLFRETLVQGFWLNHWLKKRNLLQLLWLGKSSQKLLSGDCRTEVRERLPLTEIDLALHLSTTGTTGGKILLVPNLS